MKRRPYNFQRDYDRIRPPPIGEGPEALERWAAEVLAVATHHAAIDPEGRDRTRRDELRRTARVVLRLGRLCRRAEGRQG